MLPADIHAGRYVQLGGGFGCCLQKPSYFFPHFVQRTQQYLASPEDDRNTTYMVFDSVGAFYCTSSTAWMTSQRAERDREGGREENDFEAKEGGCGSASFDLMVPRDVPLWVGCEQGYQTADPEDQYLMEPSMGSIPKDIEGTFFRNGPGKFKVHHTIIYLDHCCAASDCCSTRRR